MTAKKKYGSALTLAMMLFLLSGNSSGQEHRLGIYQGVNSAYITRDAPFPEKYRRNGYQAGIQYMVKIGKLLVGAELAYVPRGFTVLTSSLEYIYYRFDYLALPLTVSYRTKGRFFALGGIGLTPSVLIRDRVYWEDELLAPNPNGGPTRFDLGGQMDLGAGFKLAEKWAILSKLSFFRSFTTLNNDHFFGGTDFRNKGVSLGLSLEYRIK